MNDPQTVIYNKRFFVLLVTPVITTLFFGAIFLVLEETFPLICLIIAVIFEAFGIITTPIRYTFSKANLTISYCFGLKEVIRWDYIRAVISHLERPTNNTYLESYEIIYYSKEKKKFFMRGLVSKNKKTTHHLKKYYPSLNK